MTTWSWAYIRWASGFGLKNRVWQPPRDPTPSSPSDVCRPPLPLSRRHHRWPPLATNCPHRRLHELLTEVEPLTDHSGTAARLLVPSPVAGSPLPKHTAVGSHCVVGPSFSMRLQWAPTSPSSPSRHPDPTRRRQATGFGRLCHCAPGSPLLRQWATSPWWLGPDGWAGQIRPNGTIARYF
jgi:hypothetical protein